jgi:hypothetical protein
VIVSTHPLLKTKLSLLRSTGTPSIVTRSLTEYPLPLCLTCSWLITLLREISRILAYEATKDAFTIKEIGEVRYSLPSSFELINS